MSSREIREIVKARADDAVDDMAPNRMKGAVAVQLIDELLLQMEHDVEIAAEVLKRAKETGNDGLALGALRELRSCREALLVMRQRRGQIPTDLSQIARLADNEALVKDILVVFLEEDVPQQVIDRVAALVGGRTRKIGPHLHALEAIPED